MTFDELGKIVEEQTGLKTCPICGTPFKPYHSRQKTCGTDECKREHKNKYMRERIDEADDEQASKWREKKREANRKWRAKQRRLKKRGEQLDEIIKRTQRQIDFDNYIREHGLEYGKLQMQKTLALVPPIDLNINKEKESGNE